MTTDDLGKMITTANAIGADYGNDPSGDRRQVRRLAKMVAQLAQELLNQRT